MKDFWAWWSGLCGLGAGFYALRRGFKMFNHIKQAVAVIFLVVTAVELENQQPGKGAEKKAEAVKRIAAALDPILPDWLNPVVASLAPMLIDAIVALANKTGFFGSLGAA